MGTELNEDQDQEQQASAEEQAAFAASFADQAMPEAHEAEKTDAKKSEGETSKTEQHDEIKQPEQESQEAAPTAPSPAPALTAEEIAEFRASKARIAELDSNLRKANGRIGALNDLLHQTQAKKEAEGKPAALTTVEMKRLKEEFPELAEVMTSDISELISSLRPAESKQDPDAIKTVLQDLVAQERMALRQEALAIRHPDWQDLRDKPTPEYEAWMKALPDKERTEYLTSDNPYLVADKLDQFKAWRDKAAQAKLKSKERLDDAITPTGAARGQSKQAASDEELARIAFEKSFNE